MSENNTSYEIAQEKDTLSPEVDALIQEVSSHISIDPEALAQDPLETDTEYGEKIEQEFPFLSTIKPFLDKVTLEEGLKDVIIPNGYGRLVLDPKGNTPEGYVSSLALTLAMSELPVQTIESETNLPREEKLGDIISEVHPTFDKDRDDMERILELAITDKGRFLKEFKGESRSEMYNMLRTKVALSALTAMMLSSCVLQEGVIVNVPPATKEPVAITEPVDIPTATEVPATEVPATEVSTSTPTPVPTETPEPTPTATEWPLANPWGANYVQEHLMYGYEFGIWNNFYTPEGDNLGKGLNVVFADFHYEALEITEEGYFLTGSIVDKSRSHRGERYPVRLKMGPVFNYNTNEGKVVYADTEELIRNNIVEDRHYAIVLYVMDKEKGRPIIFTDFDWEESKSSQEKWREARLIVNDLMRIEGGSSEKYEFVLESAGSASVYYTEIP